MPKKGKKAHHMTAAPTFQVVPQKVPLPGVGVDDLEPFGVNGKSMGEALRVGELGKQARDVSQETPPVDSENGNSSEGPDAENVGMGEQDSLKLPVSIDERALQSEEGEKSGDEGGHEEGKKHHETKEGKEEEQEGKEKK